MDKPWVRRALIAALASTALLTVGLPAAAQDGVSFVNEGVLQKRFAPQPETKCNTLSTRAGG